MVENKPMSSNASGDSRVLTVVGASGSLGSHIVAAALERGVRVRAMVRTTSDRTRLQALGVTEFVVADLNNPASLQRMLELEPRASAVIASAAGFSAHSSRTPGDNSAADTTGYRALIDASKQAGIPRFILISIIACDDAPGVPHFSQKFLAEQYLVERKQPYLSLRGGAFIDRAQDVVPESLTKGVFPDILPGVPMALTYSRDLARYAVQAALDVPDSALNQHVDIGSEKPATGAMVATAFTNILGRPIRARPVFSRLVTALLPAVAPLRPRLRDQFAVLRWLRRGRYVSSTPEKQLELFGDLPTIEETVARYSRDKKLA